MKTGIETLSYLQNFLETSLETNDPHFNCLKQSISSMAQAAKEIAAIPQALEKNEPESLFEELFKKQITPLVNRIQALKKEQTVLMPGGWVQQDLIYEFQKDDQENLIFTIYNAGKGLEFHPSTQSEDRIQYQTIISFQIPKEILNSPDSSWLSSFIMDLVEPNVLPFVDQKCLPGYLANKAYNAELLYLDIFRRVYKVGGKKIKPPREIRLHSCPETALYEFIKHNVPDRKKAKSIVLALKQYRLECLPDPIFHPDLQMWPECAALSNAFIHTNNMPASGNSENRPINPSPSLNQFIEKPYFFNREDYASKSVDPTQFSISRLKQFQIEIENLLSKQYYQVVEQQIFSYLTTLPLTEVYFSSINASEAVDYIDTMHTLLKHYDEACEANQDRTLNPQRVVLLLSVLTLIDLIHKNPELSLYPKGIDVFFETNNFSTFKKQLEYNPYLSTGVSQLDNRLNEIFLKKELEGLKPFSLEIIQTYLNKNRALKTHLEKLYHDHQTNKNTVKFNSEQDRAINHKKLTAVVAYLYYLEASPLYKSEADKIVLFKKSIILSHCIAMAMAQFKLEPLRYKNYLNNWIGISYGKETQGHSIFHCYEKYFVEPLVLDKNKSIDYFNKIQDPLIANILDSDFVQVIPYKRPHVNEIFSLANGQNNDNPHSDLNPLYRDLMHLRWAPEFQFLLTIEYFSHDNLELFSSQKSGESLKQDLKNYLRRNLLQTGLLESHCKKHPRPLESFDFFIEQALVYFENDISTQLYFYQLQADINKQKRVELLKKVSEIDIQTVLTARDKYALLKIKLQLILEAPIENPKEFFNLFMDFSRSARADMRLSGEEQFAFKQLMNAGVNRLSNYSDTIFEYAQNKYQEVNWLGLKLQQKYPYFYAKDAQDNVVVFLDLSQGHILMNGFYDSTPPESLVQSALGQEVLENRSLNLSVTVCENKGVLIKRYDSLDSNPPERFFETQDRDRPWIYQKEKTLLNQKGFYEKQNLNKVPLKLPKYFNEQNTRVWQSVDHPILLIEQGAHHYRCCLNTFEIQLLDEKGQLTGFRVVNHTISLLTNFETADFTQILFNKETQEIKINFTRLNLKLEGRFVNASWEVHLADQTHLRLINRQATQPLMPNSLIFEDSSTKERVVYTPKGFIYTIDPNTRSLKPKTQDKAAQLYLIYINLVECKFEEAVKCIQTLLKSGPLKGTPSELEIIHKIMEGSAFSEQIDKPEAIAVRTHLLSVYPRLKSIALKILNQYNTIRKSLPIKSNLILSPSMEYQLLCRHWPQIKNDNRLNILKARYFILKREQLSKEKNFIEALQLKSPYHLDRLKIIIEKLNKKIILKNRTNTWGILNISFELPNSKLFVNPNDIDIDACVQENPAPMDLTHTLSEEAFLSQFRDLYEVARNVNSQRRQTLELFLDNRLKASCLIPLEKHNSLIPSWCGILRVVIKNPDKFPELSFNTEGSNNLDFIFETAYCLSPYLNIQWEDYISQTIEAPLGDYVEPPDNKPIPLEITSQSDKQFDYDQFIKQMGLNDFNQEVENLRKSTQKEIESLKASLRSKIQDKSYIASQDLMSEYDEKIGEQKYQESQKFDEIAQKYLSDKRFRDAVLNKINSWIPYLEKQAQHNKEAALQLINTNAQDPQTCLNRLFVLSDLSEYRKITALNDTDIQVLHNTMARFIHLSILESHYKKIKKELERSDDQLQIKELAILLLTKNHVNYTEAVLQFFQKEEGILIRRDQIEAIHQLTTQNKETGTYNNTVVQLTMGAGKTKVIAPLVNYKKANGTNLVIQMVRSSLMQVSYADICEKFSRLFNRVPYFFTFSRRPLNFKVIKDPDGIEYFQSDSYKQIYNDFYQTILSKSFVLTDNISVLSLLLQCRDILGLKYPPSQNSKSHEEWLRQIKILVKLLLLFKRHTDMMIDEGHYILDPNQEWNFTIGASVNLPKEDINLHTGFMFFCSDIKLDIQRIPNDITAYDMIKNNHLISDPDQQIPLIKRAIAKALVNNTTKANPLLYLAKCLIESNEKDCMIEYLMNEKYDPNAPEAIEPRVESILDKFSPRQRDEIAFIKGNLSIVFPITLIKNYNEHYGAIQLPNKSEIQKRKAVPFIGTHTPKNKSEFGHPIESMNYTAQLNIIEPISDSLVKELIEEALEEATEERRADPQLKLSQTQASLSFNKTFCEDTELTLERLAKSGIENNDKMAGFKNSKAVQKAILNEKVAPLIQINPTVLSTDSQELANLSSSIQVMTATPFNYRTYHSRIQFNEIDNLGVEGETVAVLKSKRKNVQVRPCRNYSLVQDFLAEMMQNCPHAKQVRLLIDVGGLFNIEKSSLKNAQEIGDFFQKNLETYALMLFVLYFDRINDILYAWDIYKKIIIQLEQSDEKFISERLQCTPKQRFTFLDQNHILSIDIEQMPDAYAFVTMNTGTFDSALVQGVNRQRKFSNNQSALIVRPHYLIVHLKDNINNILELGRKNKVEACLKMHPKAMIKKLREKVRDDLFEKVYQESDPFRKSILYRKMISLFLTRSKLSYFDLYGGVDKVLKSKAYFKQLRLSYYDQWLEALKKAELSVSNKEKEQMYRSLKVLSREALLICPETIRAQSLEGLGLEVENEVENEVEVENKYKIHHTALKANLEDPAFVFESNQYPLTKDHPSLISLFESDLILKGEFDDNLFMSRQQAWTFINSPDQDKRLDTYHHADTKPIQMVMMVTKKQAPKTGQSVILTLPEARYHLQHQSDSDYTIWFVSPHGTLLHGTPPDELPENYNKILEQIRFINGDIRKILRQKEGITWLLLNLEKKMYFLKSTILSWLPSVKAKPYPLLERVTQRILMDDNSAQTLALEKIKEAQWAKEKAERAKIRADQLATQEAQKQADLEAAHAERVAAEALDAQRLLAEKADAAQKPEQQAAAQKEREAVVKRSQEELSQRLSVKAELKRKKEEKAHQEQERLNELRKEAQAGSAAVEKRAAEKQAAKTETVVNLKAHNIENIENIDKKLPLNFLQKIINYIKDKIQAIKIWVLNQISPNNNRRSFFDEPSSKPATLMALAQKPSYVPINTSIPEHKTKARKRGPRSLR